MATDVQTTASGAYHELEQYSLPTLLYYHDRDGNRQDYHATK